MNADCPFFIQG